LPLYGMEKRGRRKEKRVLVFTQRVWKEHAAGLEKRDIRYRGDGALGSRDRPDLAYASVPVPRVRHPGRSSRAGPPSPSGARRIWLCAPDWGESNGPRAGSASEPVPPPVRSGDFSFARWPSREMRRPPVREGFFEVSASLFDGEAPSRQ
jgi:hypothetical protein